MKKLLLAILLSTATALGATTHTVTGQVRNNQGAGIAYAKVYFYNRTAPYITSDGGVGRTSTNIVTANNSGNWSVSLVTGNYEVVSGSDSFGIAVPDSVGTNSVYDLLISRQTYFFTPLSQPSGATALSGLTDTTNTTSATDGQSLVYDSTLGKWHPETITGGGGGSGDMLKADYDPNSDGVIGIGQGGTAANTALGARSALGLTIGTDVQAYDADLADLADGSLTGSKVGSGIDAGNITTGNLSVSRLNGGSGAGPSTYWRGDGTWASIPGGGGGLTSILVNQTTYVDPVNGSDVTGTRGRQDLPYSTVGAAFQVTQNGDMVILRPGTHNLTASTDRNDDQAKTTLNYLASKTNVVVVGYGATISCGTYGNMINVENCNNIAFYGITFTGGYTGFTGGLGWICAAINHRGTNDYTTVRDCRFVDIPDQAISHIGDVYGRPSSHWTIQNCDFKNIGWIASVHPDIGAWDGACVSGRPRQLIFTGNRVKEAAYMVELDGGGSSSPANDDFGYPVVTGNWAEGIRFTAVVLNGELSRYCRGGTITGNHLEGSASMVGGASLIALEGCENVLIEGNTLKLPVSSAATSYYGVEMSRYNIGNPTVNSNVVIRGNLIIGGSFGIAPPLADATGASWQNGVVVEGNTFQGIGEAGILVAGSNWTIRDNTFRNMGSTGSPTYPWAIWAYDFNSPGQLNNVWIEGNLVDDIATPTTTRILTIQSAATTASTTVTIKNNYVLRRSGTASPYSLASTAYGPPQTTIPIVDVRDFGAVPGSATDSTVPIFNAINSYSPAKGGIVYAGDNYFFNLSGAYAITNQNITLRGGGACRDEGLGVFTNRWEPYATNSPVIQVGDGSFAVPGFRLQDATIYGLQGNPSRMGVWFATAREGSVDRVAIWRFATNLLFQANGSSYEVTRIAVRDSVFRMPSGPNDAAGIMVAMPSGNNGQHYTTGISFNNCRMICGQVNATNFWGLKVYNTKVTLNDYYSDSYPNARSVFLGNLTGSTGTPLVEASAGVWLDDSGGGTNPQVWASHTSSQAPTEYLTGRISLTSGRVAVGDGTTVYNMGSGAKTFLGYYSVAQQPGVIDRIHFMRPGQAWSVFGSSGEPPTNVTSGFLVGGGDDYFIQNHEGNIHFRTVGSLIFNSAASLSSTFDLSGLKSIAWGQSIPNVVDLGTVGGGGTVPLTGTNNNFKATFSGSTATISLPLSPSDGTWVLDGTTTYSGGQQIITIPALIRPGFDFDSTITTITNNATSSGKFTIWFKALGGSFTKVSVEGDAYEPPPTENVGTVHAPDGATTANRVALFKDTTGTNITQAGFLNSDVVLKSGVTLYEERWIPASAMLPTATSGPSLRTNTWATTTDGQVLEVLDFDGSTDESAQFTLTLPDSWDASTVKAKVIWKAVAATSGTAVWSVAAGSYTDADTAGNTLGTAVNISDGAQSTTNTVAVSAASSAITVGGTPSAGHQVWFRVYRLPTNGSDDITSDCSLIGVQLQYGRTATSTAW